MKIFEIYFPSDNTSSILFADGYRDARKRCYDKWGDEPVEITRIDIL